MDMTASSRGALLRSHQLKAPLLPLKEVGEGKTKWPSEIRDPRLRGGPPTSGPVETAVVWACTSHPLSTGKGPGLPEGLFWE